MPKQVTATFLPRLQFTDPLFHGSLFKDLGLDKMKGWRPRETVCWSFKLGVIGWSCIWLWELLLKWVNLGHYISDLKLLYPKH